LSHQILTELAYICNLFSVHNSTYDNKRSAMWAGQEKQSRNN